MTGFIKRNLAPSDRLGEILFGLIMALGFTGAVRIGMEEADNRTLFVSILGCNLAWGVVDGVMYVLVQLFERGRRFRVAKAVQKSTSEADALKLVEQEYGEQLEPVLGEAERTEVYRKIAAGVRGTEVPAARPTADDFLGGLAVGLVILLATAPVLVPFLLLKDPTTAVRISHGIGLLLLFCLGVWWGRAVGARGWRIGLGLLAVGLVLVGLCLLLGG
jgi:VIT1/CCC1 family predicted Fe2+/Mn2+ transporter